MSKVEAAIDAACKTTLETVFQSKDLNLRRATASDVSAMKSIMMATDKAFQPRHQSSEKAAASATTNSEAFRLDVPNFFGLVVTSNKEKDNSDVVGFATFYLAYSTWDATVLYLDKLFLMKDNADNNKAIEWSFHYTLADIAGRLKCARYTWQHFADCPDYPNETQPEQLKGWLTLHWNYINVNNNDNDKDKDDDTAILNHSAPWSAESDREAINLALEGAAGNKTNDLRIRLSTVDDLDHIERLVMGLAEFEKEPESVHVTKDDYQRDGFTPGQSPLFHCLLLEDHATKNDNGQPYVCGMAFTYFGYAFGEGRFLYLEDLYIEEKYRGKGGGSIVMKILKEIAQSTHCIRVVWQALDWNTPAITFYNKIGARVTDGLKTARFAGKDLQQFHDGRKDY